MKRIWILAVVLCLLAGCSVFQPGETGTAPIVGTLNAIQAANAASAPFNPYAIPIAGVLGTLTAVISAFAAAKQRQLNRTTKKYTAHKRVMADEMISRSPEAASDLYARIGKQRKALGL